MNFNEEASKEICEIFHLPDSAIVEKFKVKYSTEQDGHTLLIEYNPQTKEHCLIAMRPKSKEYVKTLKLPDFITKISSSYNIRVKAERIELPKNLKEISYGFCNEDMLEVVFNQKLRKIKASAFRCCYKIKELVIPASVNTIESSAFSSCDLLETVIFEGCPQKICRSAFGYCKNLKKVIIKGNMARLKSISNDTFYGCNKALELPAELKLFMEANE